MKCRALSGWGWLALVLLVFGGARGADFVLQLPALAYGNSYDMVRVQACFGLWPNIETKPSGAHSYAPADYYTTGHPLPRENCYASSGLGFIWVAVQLAKVSQYFSGAGEEMQIDLRWFGIVHLLGLWVAVAVVQGALKGAPRLQCANAAFFAMVLCDPLNLLYANTLYLEFSSLIFGYVSIALLWVLLCREWQSQKLTLATGVALFLYASSKMQYSYSALCLALLYVFVRWRSWRADAKYSALLLAVALAGYGFISIYTAINPAAQTFYTRLNLTNKTNVVLGVFMEASENPVRMADRLGLPRHCAAAAGKNWFTQGVQEHHPCPQVAQVSRALLLWVSLSEPEMLKKLIKQTAEQTQDWITPRFGAKQGAVNYQLTQDSFGRQWSLASLVHALPPASYLIFLVLVPAVTFLAAVGAGFSANARARKPFILMLICCLLSGLTFFASIFGDGALGAVKQCHFMYSMLTAWMGAFFAHLLLLWRGQTKAATQ